MMSKEVRLFIGNLPNSTTENELQQEFSHYGAVEKVELKQKKSQDSPEVQSTFAFITASFDDRMLEQCLQEFKEQKYRGQFLQVSVARENFLEKLKREREEANQRGANKASESLNNSSATEVRGDLPTFSAKIPSDDESSSESSEEDEPVVQKAKSTPSRNNSTYFESEEVDSTFLKKKSKRFLENGKIKIDRTGCDREAIHVINKKTVKAKNELDEKSKIADDKRKESVQKMKNSYDLQKSLIKNALAGVDGPKQNKKIFFDDDGGEAKSSNKIDKKPIENPIERKIKQALFDDENEDEVDFSGNFEIKKQFEGEKGKKLMKLQNRYQGDSRFNLDAKFLDDENGDAHEAGDDRAYELGNETNQNNEEDDERKWQYNILEGVVGRNLYQDLSKESKKKAPTMLRFDPTRSDHSKFVEEKRNKKRTKGKEDKDRPAKRAKHDETAEKEQAQNDEPPVSMDHFYEVRSDFQKSLGGGGFSLLSMFNRTADDGVVKTMPGAVDKSYEEKLIAKNSVKFEIDPFKGESSDEEADEKAATVKKMVEGQLSHESFFTMNSSDSRVAEALSFFKPPVKADDGENEENYDNEQRQELRDIVKRKMKKSIQSALPRHAKANKKFRRFAKNL